jgi:hypothetical protein
MISHIDKVISTGILSSALTPIPDRFDLWQLGSLGTADNGLVHLRFAPVTLSPGFISLFMFFVQEIK